MYCGREQIDDVFMVDLRFESFLLLNVVEMGWNSAKGKCFRVFV